MVITYYREAIHPLYQNRQKYIDSFLFEFWGTRYVDIKTSVLLCYDVMRTTLTIDDDIAIQLEKIRRHQNAPLKQIVNDALRRGLQVLSQKNTTKKHFKTKTVSLGACLMGNLDDVAEALSVAEGERLK